MPQISAYNEEKKGFEMTDILNEAEKGREGKQRVFIADDADPSIGFDDDKECSAQKDDENSMMHLVDQK